MSFWQRIVSDFAFLRVQIIPLRKLKLFMTAIFLVAVINGASASFFLGVSRDNFFYETDAETLIISDERAATPITGRISSSLIGILRGIPGVVNVSPEILSLCVINQNDQPVIVRGITEAFRDIISSLTMQSGDWLFDESNNGSRAVIIGQTLSEKLNLQAGQSILLSSSILDEIISVRVIGVFETKRSFDEEILASLDFGRTLEGLNSNDVNIARVKIDPKVTTKAQVKDFVNTLSNNAVVTGYISDEYNQPVSRARILVFLKNDLVKEAITNNNGYYALQLTPGNYRFVIYKPSTHESFVVRNKTLEPGARYSWDFELNRKKASVQGLVIDSFLFLPINDCSVYLKDAMNETVEETQTNATGYFTFTGVPFGDKFFLECNHPDYFQVPTSFASFKFLQDEEGSTEIKVSQRNLFLAPRTSNVSGYLTAWESGQSIMNALITLKTPGHNYTTLSDSQGRYTFLGINEGNYSIVISHPSYSPKRQSFFLKSNVHFTLNESLYPSFPLFSGINTLSGHMKGFQNQSLPDTFIELRLASNNSWVASTLALSDGTFTFEGIADLAYKITIFNLNYWSKAINFDFGGKQTGFIDVTLNPKLSALICFVVNRYTQELVENTIISLYYDDELRTQVFSSSEHTFTNLLPGNYTINVQQDDFISFYQTFLVSINSQVPAILNLTPKNSSISGQVIDLASGQPLQSILVQLLISPNEMIAEKVTGPDGSFLFTDIISGNYSLKLSASGYPIQYIYDIVLLPNQQFDVSVYMKRSADILDIDTLNRLFQINIDDLSYLQFDSEGLEGILGLFETTFYAMALFLVILSTLSILSVVSQPIRESRNELVLLRVLGATQRQVAFTVTVHLMFSAFFAAIVGIILGSFIIVTFPFFKTIQIGFLLINPKMDLVTQGMIAGLMSLLVGFTAFNLTSSSDKNQKKIISNNSNAHKESPSGQ